MSETTMPESAPTEPAAPHETFGQRLGDWLHHGEQDAATAVADFQALLRDHASQVFGVAGDALAVVKLIDPADVAAVTAAETFVIKVLGVAQSAAKIAGTALSPGSKTA